MSNESLHLGLNQLFEESKQGSVTVNRICRVLAGRGYAILLIIFSLPFCLPITIPGLSTPFGLALAFLGLRLAFGKRLWWPHWILKKEVSPHALQSVIGRSQRIVRSLQRILYPRLTFLVNHPLAHRVHGLMIFVLSILLALPLPFPFTNMFAAVPIVCLGFGLLEDDGVAIIVAYIFGLTCFAYFGFLLWLGGVGLKHVMNIYRA